MIKLICRLVIFTACLSISISAVSAQTAEDNSNDALLLENQMEQEVSSDFVVNSDNDDNLTLENSHDTFDSDALLDDENFDNLFDDSEDTEAIVTSPVDSQNGESSKKRGIILTGNLESRLGGFFYFYPREVVPGATFDSTISFGSKPNDYFSIRGSLLANFPKMQAGLYELYINYSLWDFAFITAGKKEVKWGSARIFDTNILDDAAGTSEDNKNSYDNKYNPENVLTDDLIDPDNAKFTVMMSVPIWRLNITGLINYYDYTGYLTDNPLYDRTEWSKTAINDFSYAAMIECNLNNLSFDIFAKTWAENDDHKLPPALGVDVNFQLGDFHFYTQYLTHIQVNANNAVTTPRMRGTASVWWATREKVNLGFILEYQFVLDWTGLGFEEPKDLSLYFNQYLAFEGAWVHINGSQFTAAVKYFHDFGNKYGTIVPGVKIHNILPNADLDLGIPIYYGSICKVGLGVQLKLNVAF